jgi:signal transduction histidine kinase
MGLAVVHGIVKHHKGAVSVTSTKGKGAVFSILFPVLQIDGPGKAFKTVLKL